MYSVHQHWDPLKVCAVGKSYSPEFYSFIENVRVRSVLETIAQETEEDYQKLIALLESFGVQTIRPTLTEDREQYLTNGKYDRPPMCPRDTTIMIGEQFYIDQSNSTYTNAWPNIWSNLVDLVRANGNEVIPFNNINGAMTTRAGKDLYHGTTDRNLYHGPADNTVSPYLEDLQINMTKRFPNYRNHIVNTVGHGDSMYCPVKPGLIVSLHDVQIYADTFPDWEVVYLPEQSWLKVEPFLQLKGKNAGKWWVPGQELNDEFTEFIENWLTHWVGYVEETVFDVNMLVIDKHNVACNNYNKDVFDAFERHGITPHIINFRHRYFWDGGLHCITSDIHREGIQEDYFPERGANGYIPYMGRQISDYF